MTSSMFTRRLVWQPVAHSCGHFEARLMRQYTETVQAASPCSACAPQGRSVQPNYATLRLAAMECAARNIVDGR